MGLGATIEELVEIPHSSDENDQKNMVQNND
jgi:hypothetical protein